MVPHDGEAKHPLPTLFSNVTSVSFMSQRQWNDCEELESLVSIALTPDTKDIPSQHFMGEKCLMDQRFVGAGVRHLKAMPKVCLADKESGTVAPSPHVIL